jgi:hypothetical protein
MGSSPSRPASFARPSTDGVAPGQYESDLKFAQQTKSFVIGEKREQRAVESMGPGSYSPERGDSITKSKTPAVDFNRSPGRPVSFGRAGEGDSAAPG